MSSFIPYVYLHQYLYVLAIFTLHLHIRDDIYYYVFMRREWAFIGQFYPYVAIEHSHMYAYTNIHTLWNTLPLYEHRTLKIHACTNIHTFWNTLPLYGNCTLKMHACTNIHTFWNTYYPYMGIEHLIWTPAQRYQLHGSLLPLYWH